MAIPHKKELWVNLENVSVICEEDTALVVNGNNGRGNGLINIDEESMQKILRMMLQEKTQYK